MDNRLCWYRQVSAVGIAVVLVDTVAAVDTAALVLLAADTAAIPAALADTVDSPVALYMPRIALFAY